MDKLTLQVLPDSVVRGQELYDCLFKHIDATLHNSSLEWNNYKGYTEITVGRPNRRAAKSAKSEQEWTDAVCAVLVDFVLDHAEEEMLIQLIRKDKSCTDGEVRDILGYCKQIMNEEDIIPEANEDYHGRARRRRLLSQDFATITDQQAFLNLEGFLRFRTTRYTAELRDIIEYATDEFLMDQQYKEFISLLRYFVYIQDSKIPAAHLMHKGGNEFMLLNEQMKPIDTEQLDTTFKVEFLDKDYNLEDLIVSTLITIAPERIYIHTRQPELTVIQTISQIFEDRSEICEYCRVCSSILDDMGKQDKLSP